MPVFPSTTVNSTKYLFIDGPFFEALVKEVVSRYAPDETHAINYPVLGDGFSRVIFYDALPVRKPTQDKQRYETAFEEKHNFLNSLRRIDSFQVRDGYTRNRPGAANRIEQKGVDTWIAVDALLYAVRGTVDEVWVMTSDLDLYPLFEGLLQTNAKGVLLYDPKRTSDELIFAADRSIPIRQCDVFRLLPLSFRKRFEVRQYGTRHVSGNPLISEVFEETGKIQVFQNPTNGMYWSSFDRIEVRYECPNILALITHINELHGVSLMVP